MGRKSKLVRCEQCARPFFPENVCEFCRRCVGCGVTPDSDCPVCVELDAELDAAPTRTQQEDAQ